MTDDPYCYPGTSVLRNLGNYRSHRKLALFETIMVGMAYATVKEEPLTGGFSKDRLKETHRRIFGKVYEWAGKFRENVGVIAKDRGLGYGAVVYCNSRFVGQELDKVFHNLRKENNLKSLDKDSFTERLAYFYGELDAVHPFREGNSRTLRQFTTDLAKEAGYKIQWGKILEKEDGINLLYKARDIAVLKADSSLFANIFKEITVPLEKKQSLGF